jgi:two-component system, cell cycle sensor histidine kinase and response regulator CckA
MKKEVPQHDDSTAPALSGIQQPGSGFPTQGFVGKDGDISRTMQDAPQVLRKQILSSEDNLRTIFNSVYDAIFLLELNGRILDINEKGLEMFALQADQASDLSLQDDLSSAENPFDELQHYWKRAILGENQFFEWKARRRGDGSTFDVEVFLRRITLNGAQSILAAIRDVTERKRLQEQLFLAQRMESVATVVGGIAHEFNNTLNNVLGFTNLIRKYIQDEAKILKYCTVIEQSVNRGADLGHRLLAFSKETKRESLPIDLAAIIGEVVERMQNSLGTGMEVACRIDPKLMKVTGDRKELSQAIANVLQNAKEAIAQQNDPARPGALLVAADNGHVSEALASKLMLPADSPCIIVRISDNGVGIPEAIRDKIFDPFFTTKERKGGAGLGLALVYSTVRSHRGSILVESEEGKGSTFQIYLPVIDSQKIADHGDLALKAKNKTHYVLLVDDEEPMREFSTDILQEDGYKILTAADGMEAVEIYRKRHKEIAVVILDLIMPKMDGGQTFLELRKINPKVKAVFCTGYASDGIIAQMLTEEDIQAIQKPFRSEELKKVVREVIERE